jgi:hypothetical protein
VEGASPPAGPGVCDRGEVCPPWARPGWVIGRPRRAGRHVGLTVVRFRVGAGSVVEAGLDLGCPSRTEHIPLGGVWSARPVWDCRSGVRSAWRLIVPSSRASRGSDPRGILGRCWPCRVASWSTVFRVGPGCWPGDVARPTLVRGGLKHARGNDGPGGVVKFGERVVIHPGIGASGIGCW